MQFRISLMALFAISIPVHSATSTVNAGSSLTHGPSSNHYSLTSGVSNPAMAPLMLKEGENWRINYLPGFSFGVEIGPVDNFVDDLDELIDIIEDSSSLDESADETLERFNRVLDEAGESGYLTFAANLMVPFAPFYFEFESLGDATFFVDFNFNVKAALSILDDELQLDPQNQNFTTNTSIYLKSGLETRLTLGYGRELFKDQELPGRFYAGAKLNFFDLDLSKQVTRLEDLDGDGVEDVLEDEYDSNLESNFGVGLDLGFVWDADWYRVGLTLENLNAPEFSYGAIGQDCESRPENTVERNSCEIARVFIDEGRIRSEEIHTKNRLARLDGLLKITPKWLISSSLDLAVYDDVVGFENQWVHFSTSYELNGHWKPSPRLGYQMNLAGTELSSYLFGLSFFRIFNLDVEYGVESVEIDGEEAPRRLGFSLGFEEAF